MTKNPGTENLALPTLNEIAGIRRFKLSAISVNRKLVELSTNSRIFILFSCPTWRMTCRKGLLKIYQQSFSVKSIRLLCAGHGTYSKGCVELILCFKAHQVPNPAGWRRRV